MNNKEKAKIILRILNKTYPKVPIPLNYKNTFTLLVSVLLSAQCTDVNVNNVTKAIYPKYNKPHHFMKLGRKKIEKLIKRIGIFSGKNITVIAEVIAINYLLRTYGYDAAKIFSDKLRDRINRKSGEQKQRDQRIIQYLQGDVE